MRNVPPEIEADLQRAIRLEWWTLGWQSSIVVVLALVMGSSQAMKSAWIEDILGLVPAIVFLISVRFEQKCPSDKFPFGFTRVNSLAFLISATALVLMGGYLFVDSLLKLIEAEHPTLEPITLFGQQVWTGWLMMGALAYSVVPPMVLGRLKSPIAFRLQDKVLHTDALMQKADWMTGLAAIVGITGIGFGLWWADAAAAALIACDILRDGYRALLTATAELVDGAPRKLENDEIAEEARDLHRHLAERFPGAEIRLRETGRYIVAEIHGVATPQEKIRPADYWQGDRERSWRLVSLTFAP